MRGTALKVAAVTIALIAVAACAVGPDYERPPAPVPLEFKELAGFKVAEPRDAEASGAWWVVFADAELDALVSRVAISNQSLAASAAAFRQAVALVDQARAGFYPTLTANASVRRAKSGGGGDRSFATGSTGGAGGGATPGTVVTVKGGSDSAQTTYQPSLAASWELDVWGRIRRSVESNLAQAEATAADLAAATLSAQAELASAYFQLRARDAERVILDDAVAAYERSLKITQDQHREGLVTRGDVALAETQLETARAQAIAVAQQRAQLEHAIAVLVGMPPVELSIPPVPWAGEPPKVPVALPSTLLERRPDIAAAERRMAAASASIGVAMAAYFPEISLTGSLGYAATALGNVFDAANRAWSVTLALAQTMIDGGLRSAQVEEARAALEQAVANYRQVTLTSFREVEDQLVALRLLEEQAAAQARAVAAARDAERIELNRYKAGTVDYTAVVTAQQQALNSERAALTLRENRFIAAVALIQALGGGWTIADLPQDLGQPQPRLF